MSRYTCPLSCGSVSKVRSINADGVTFLVCPDCLGIAIDGGILRDLRNDIDLTKILRPIIERVVRETSIDPLTQVKNRRFFFHRLASELKSAAHQYFVSVAAFAFDLDELYEIVGSRGGDTVLQSYAAAFLSAIRIGDNFARVEPNIFGLILTSADELRALEIVDRILAKISEHKIHTHNGRPVNLKFEVALTVAHDNEFPQEVWLRALQIIVSDEKNAPRA